MTEVKYIVQVKLSVIRQIEFIDDVGLELQEIRKCSDAIAMLEFGKHDELEVVSYEIKTALTDTP